MKQDQLGTKRYIYRYIYAHTHTYIQSDIKRLIPSLYKMLVIVLLQLTIWIKKKIISLRVGFLLKIHIIIKLKQPLIVQEVDLL